MLNILIEIGRGKDDLKCFCDKIYIFSLYRVEKIGY